MKQKRDKILDRMKRIKESIRFIKNDKIIPNKRKFIEESDKIEKKTSSFKNQVDDKCTKIFGLYLDKRNSVISFLKSENNGNFLTTVMEDSKQILQDVETTSQNVLNINDELYSYMLYLNDLRLEMEKNVRETLKLVSKELVEMNGVKTGFQGSLINEIKKMNNDFTY